ncbi:hypothetical protein ACHABQ_02880 [Nesterenkonia aurantiaca]|uniref:hypothetical protein n=1 Tax=Nesterenkonia aurantiaca TaxID=1436010 RepID=UPI003EE59AF0
MPAWFRNQSASEVERIKRKINRAEAKSQLRNGRMVEGTLTIAENARIEFEGDGNMPDIPNATPSRRGLMTAEYADKLENLPPTTLGLTAGQRVTIGGQVVFYDSGWRDISSLFVSNVNTSASWLHVRRTLNDVRLRGVIAFDAGSGLTDIATLPSGPWRPPIQGSSGVQGAMIQAHSSGGAVHNLRLNVSGVLAFINTTTSGATSNTRPTALEAISLQGTFTAPATLPTSLIGNPT